MSTHSTSLKLSYNNEVHRLSTRPQNLKLLLKAVREVFPEMNKESEEKRVSLKYEDADGDMIVIATEDDYQTALVSSDSDKKSLKIFVNGEDNGVSSSILLTSFDIKPESDNKEANKTDEVVIEEEKVEEQPQILPAKEEEHHEVPEQQPDHKHHHGKCHRFKFERKLNMVRELTRQALQEEIPTIAMIVKQMLENPSEQPQQPQPKPKTSKAVHHGVRCDVCGVAPIVGVRYKCTVLHDYDLCENCESTVDHPYPLLKLRTEAHRNVKVAVTLPEHASHHRPDFHGLRRGPHHHHHQKPLHCSKRKEGESGPRCHGLKKMFGGILKHLNRPEETEKVSKAFKDGFGVFQEAVKEMTSHIEQTISPQNANDNSKEETKQEAPKQESTVEATKSDNSNDKKSDIEEKSSKTSESDYSFVEKLSEKPEAQKTEVIENKLPEGNELEKVKAEEYTAEVVSKAKVILDIFPQCKLEDVCEVVKHSPAKSVEDLVQDFLASF